MSPQADQEPRADDPEREQDVPSRTGDGVRGRGGETAAPVWPANWLENRYRAARLLAANESPFLATALYAMIPVPYDGLGTVAVDAHWRVYVDPAAIAAWSPAALAGALIHEVSHLIRDHHGRARRLPVSSEATRQRWNIAADIAINDDCVDAGIQLPRGSAVPATFGLDAHLVEEQYYERLTDGAVDLVWCQPGSGVDGTPRDFEFPADAAPTVDETTADRIRVRVAAEINRAEHGTVPTGWQRWGGVSIPSRIDWRRALARELRRAAFQRIGQVDEAWHRPARRPDDESGVLSPGHVEPVVTVAVVVDTSGSMDTRALAQTAGEVDALLTRMRLRNVRVVAGDTTTQWTGVVQRADRIGWHGGGGTDLRPLISAAARSRPRPQVVIVITDGRTPWPTRPPCPVLACLIDRDAPAPPSWIRAVWIS